MNPYVLVWTLVSAAGVVLSILLLLEASLDIRALEGIRNGRRLYARGRAISEAIRLIMHSGFFLIGLTVLFSPTRGPSLIVLVLIGGNILLIVNSIIAWYVRHEAIHEDRAASDLETEAVATALALRETADKAAERLLELATLTANIHGDRVTEAAERTADNTARIAENTDPANGLD
jgi:hypothetical protein